LTITLRQRDQRAKLPRGTPITPNISPKCCETVILALRAWGSEMGRRELGAEKPQRVKVKASTTRHRRAEINRPINIKSPPLNSKSRQRGKSGPGVLPFSIGCGGYARLARSDPGQGLADFSGMIGGSPKNWRGEHALPLRMSNPAAP